jgi:hypothetical protein
VALDAGQVIALPVGRLRELVAGDPALGDLVLRAYLLRRSILIGLGAGLRIIGSRYSPDARRVTGAEIRELHGDQGRPRPPRQGGIAMFGEPRPVRAMSVRRHHHTGTPGGARDVRRPPCR